MTVASRPTAMAPPALIPWDQVGKTYNSYCTTSPLPSPPSMLSPVPDARSSPCIPMYYDTDDVMKPSPVFTNDVIKPTPGTKPLSGISLHHMTNILDSFCSSADQDHSQLNSQNLSSKDKKQEVDVVLPLPTVTDDLQNEVKIHDLINDVTLVPHQSATMDMDFLQDLDELEFDFDDLDQVCDTTLENDLQSFIDTTLDGGIDTTVDYDINDKSIDNGMEEDMYRKEYFMKLLGLQKIPDNSTTHVQSNNRKRKYDKISDHHTPSSSGILSSSKFLSSSNTMNIIINNNHNNSNNNNNKDTHSKRIIADDSIQTTSPFALHGISSVSKPRSPSLLTSPSPSTSVPYKLCSCSTTDWQRSILYSTAKSPSITSIHTSPSTASSTSTRSRQAQLLPSHPSLRSVSPGNNLNAIPIQASTLLDIEVPSLDEKINRQRSKTDENEKPNFENSTTDEIDQEAEEILSWLDSHVVEVTMAGTGQSQSSMETQTQSSTDSGIASMVDAVPCPACHQTPATSSPHCDPFTDLESYASDTTPIMYHSAKSSCSDSAADDDDCVKSSSESNSSNDIKMVHNYCDTMSKPHQLHLSLLSDEDRNSFRSNFNEKTDSGRADIDSNNNKNHNSCTTCRLADQADSNRSCHPLSVECPSSPTTSISSQSSTPSSIQSFSPSHRLDKNPSSSSSSFSSSSSSSSSLSSPSPFSSQSVSSPTDSTHLNLLDLFADDNYYCCSSVFFEDCSGSVCGSMEVV